MDAATLPVCCRRRRRYRCRCNRNRNRSSIRNRSRTRCCCCRRSRHRRRRRSRRPPRDIDNNVRARARVRARACVCSLTHGRSLDGRVVVAGKTPIMVGGRQKRAASLSSDAATARNATHRHATARTARRVRHHLPPAHHRFASNLRRHIHRVRLYYYAV